MALLVASLKLNDNAVYVSSWTEFKKYLDGTIATLQFHYEDHDGLYWRIATQEWGGNSYWIDLTQDGGAADLDFQANFATLTEAEPVPTMIDGLGVAGTPAGGVLSIQGVPGGTAIPVSGSITATNASVGVNGAAVPGSSTQIGATDGTNLQNVRAYDVDDGGGTEYALGVVLRRSESGGSVEIGDSTNPIRIDPTGTTAQPVTDNGGSLTVDGTVAATQSGTWNINNITGTVSLPTGAATEATLSSIDGKTPALGQATMANSSPVVIASDQSGVPVTDNGGSLTVDGTVTANAGTGFAPVATDGSAALTTGYQVLGTDGTNAQILSTNASGHVNIADGGNSITVDGSVSVTGTPNVNLAQVAGTATAVNNGTADAGTQRVVIASDQTAFSVDVTPTSPVATDYLPIRLTDGTNFIQPAGSELATFTATAAEIVTGNNKSMISILNADATKLIKIREIYIVNTRNSAIAGVEGMFELRRATGHSVGTLLTSETHDTADTLDSDVTVRTNATIAGESSTYLYRKEYSTDEWNTGGTKNEAIAQATQITFPVFKAESPMKPIVLRQNQALNVKFTTNSTTGIFDITIVFTQE